MPKNNVYRLEGESSDLATKLVLGLVGIWFLSAFAGGMRGIFNQAGGPPLSVGFFVLVPISGFTLAYAVSPSLRRVAARIPLWLITVAHLWRLVGIVFVLGAVMNFLPPQFGFPEGLGDVAAAVFCLPLALALRKNNPSPGVRTAFIAWNVFGLIDLVSAISLGILYSPSTFGVLRTDISTAFMTVFPVNLIPTFFVPLFILLHMLALSRSGELRKA